ncbi:Gfo/Idh/MocA family protein [Roseimaritima sediminicola]|uniref:Gfo/Idh/MocA family protein n=1 Tax=Roseimaritima sediminicola TaxID=2662066 RepID=UPI00129844C9|nr:Gfo/Idh/MocA family oxidoreductase [Roseimaritima sediminicola]
MSLLNRRRALQLGTAGTAAFFHSATAPASRAENSPNEKLNIACIGIGGRGAANVNGVRSENLVAMVDVDEQRGGAMFEKHSGARRFKDYRRMFDAMGQDLDAVVISTPDHTHFHPAYAAMQLGLHVYLEKPLAHNVWETRTLTDLARRQGLATQLGAQRHAMANMRRVVELVQSGAIGKVHEVHSWIGGSRGMPDVPEETPPVPATLDYELWLGPAPRRPYHPSFCPYGWRFWWDYGTGETGNFGCHILDIPFWALGLKYPDRVEASGPQVDAQRTPKSMHCTYRFPQPAGAAAADAVRLHWYHGTPEILAQQGLSAKGNNTLFLGEDGKLLCGFNQLQLLPEEKYAQYQPPEPFLEDSPGFYREWLQACRGGQPASCHFDYSGPLTETVLLGNVAYRAGGFDWDPQSLRTGDNSAAQSLIREAYHEGWEV